MLVLVSGLVVDVSRCNRRDGRVVSGYRGEKVDEREDGTLV